MWYSLVGITAGCQRIAVKSNTVIEKADILTRDRSIYMEQYQRYADTEVLPGDAIADLLDRVTVWPDGRLEVLLKFTDELPAFVGTGWEMKAAE